MNTKEAILAFSQSEKAKAALISLTHALELIEGLSYEEKRGAETVLRLLLSAVAQEARLAKVLVRQDEWDQVESLIDRALVMVESGVAREATSPLARAISMVTTTGQRSMTLLKEEGLL